MTALGLDANWVVKFAGSADALWAEVAAAEKEGRGTIISVSYTHLRAHET